MNHAGDMNRKLRRKQSRSKTITRRAGVTYLTVAGVLGGSLGIAGPAYAAADYNPTTCDQLEVALGQLATNGGSLVANIDTDLEPTCYVENKYTDDYDFNFGKTATITGPASGELVIEFEGASSRGFMAVSPSGDDEENVLTIRNLTLKSVARIESLVGSFSGADLVINNTRFIDSDFSLSAISAQGQNVTVTDSDFVDLTSLDYGAAIYGRENTSLTVTGSSFNDVESDKAGGAIYAENHGSISISNSSFTNVQSNENGGAIFVEYGDSLTVSNSSFTNVVGNNGGSIYVEGTEDVTVSETQFTNSRAIYGGGSLSINGTKEFSVESSAFTTNSAFVSDLDGTTASVEGGAISYASAESNATPSVIDSNFSNLKSSMGGAIYNFGATNSTFAVAGNTFHNLDTIGGNGGAIYGVEGELLVTDSTFSDLTSTDQGGAIFSEGSLTVSGSSFFENSSVAFGGAISSASTSIDNSTFVNNSASNGAAFSSFSEGSIVSNSTFLNNGDSDSGSIASDFTYFFGNIMANESAGVKAIAEGYEFNFDLGANLYTDDSVIFTDPISEGEGASKLVEFDDLKLSALALNQTSPVNAGTTKTVAIGADSVAKDYYSATSAGINPTGKDVGNDIEFDTRIASLDQRGVARQPSIARLDVGAYEAGDDPEPTPSETAEPTPSETAEPTPSETAEPTPSETAEPTPSETAEPTPSETAETTDTETLAETGLENQTSFLGLIGIGLAAILGASVGLVRRRRKV
jgi:LPXTG-motif cell wall-anchored protein